MEQWGKFLDLRQLSRYSSLSKRTLQRHLPEMPHYRIGGKILVDREEFDQWVKGHRIAPEDLESLAEKYLSDMLAK